MHCYDNKDPNPVYQIYLIKLKSGEMYIGQHRGDIFRDSYFGSPGGKKGCNLFFEEDVAERIVLEEVYGNAMADLTEAGYIRKYREKYGCVKRVLDEYPKLKLLYSEGLMLNISSGNNYEDFARANKIIDENIDIVIKAIRPKTRGKRKTVKKKVRQLTLDKNSLGIFENPLEASLHTGIAKKYIVACCDGRQKTAANYVFEYAQ